MSGAYNSIGPGRQGVDIDRVKRPDIRLIRNRRGYAARYVTHDKAAVRERAHMGMVVIIDRGKIDQHLAADLDPSVVILLGVDPASVRSRVCSPHDDESATAERGGAYLSLAIG